MAVDRRPLLSFLAPLAILGATAIAVFGEHRRHLVEVEEIGVVFARERQEAAIRTGRAVEDVIRPIYEGIRTMSRLPGVQRHLALGVPLDPDAQTTVQEIYNNLGSSVALSEIYLVPGNLDPDAPAGSGIPTAPTTTYDALILGPQAAAGTEGGAGDGLEEVEIFEYRLMKQQLAHLQIVAPKPPPDLNVALASGPEVITCDNHRINRAKVDDEDRKGLVFTVPVYRDGAMVGGVSGIVLTAALRDRLPPGTAALRDPSHDLLIGSRTDRRWEAYRDDIVAHRPNPSLRFSAVLPLRFAPLEEDWYLWSFAPDEDLASRADYGSEHLFYQGGLLVTILGGIGAAVVVARAQRQSALDRARVHQVVEAAQAAVDGDLDRGLPAEGSDAVGQLVAAVGQVLALVRSTVQTTGAAGGRLRRAASRLEQSTGRINQAARQGQEAAGTLSQTIEQLSADVEESARQLAEVSTAVRLVASEAEQSKKVAVDSVSRVDHAAQSADRLQIATLEIGSAVHSIEEITEATRILALNASMEASRAGTAGRGFAVVAQEVRSLAHQTSQAAQTIQSRVESIRTEVASAASAIGDLRVVVTEIRDRQTSIAATVEQQSAALGVVADGAARSARGTAALRAGMGRVAGVAKETNATAQEVSAVSEAVVGTAQELVHSVSRFGVT